MKDRLESDLERLREAVAIYRVYSEMQGNASDSVVIGFAHRGGRLKPQADVVRQAWQDYVQGRQYAKLETIPYMIAKDGRSADGGNSKRGGARAKSAADTPRRGRSRPAPEPPPDDDDILF